MSRAPEPGPPALVVLVLSVLALVAGCGLVEEPSAPGEPVAGSQAAAPRVSAAPGARAPAGSAAEDAVALIDSLTRSLSHPDAAPAALLAAPWSERTARVLAVVAGNARRLGLHDITFRCVEGCAGRRWPAGGPPARVQVEVTWHSRVLQPGRGVALVELLLAREGERLVIASPPGGERVPLWLLERVTLRAGRRAAVVAGVGVAGDRLLERAEEAVATVGAALPGPLPGVVVEAPSSRTGFARSSGVPLGEARMLAAVTAAAPSVDGRGAHVHLNPEAFDRLGPVGQRVVLAHEVTHVALGVTDRPQPPAWLREGFADHVALGVVQLPVRTLAAGARAFVRASGLPRRLPGEGQLSPARPGVGARYEASWLAVRLLADRYGERRLATFYQVSARRGTRHAFTEVLGTTQRLFEARWRRRLAEVAR